MNNLNLNLIISYIIYKNFCKKTAVVYRYHDILYNILVLK